MWLLGFLTDRKQSHRAPTSDIWTRSLRTRDFQGGRMLFLVPTVISLVLIVFQEVILGFVRRGQ